MFVGILSFVSEGRMNSRPEMGYAEGLNTFGLQQITSTLRELTIATGVAALRQDDR